MKLIDWSKINRWCSINDRRRPWHDAQVIACARTVTCANQEKRGLGKQRKARPKVKLRGWIWPVPNTK